ncbi:MAG: LamG domain-containing protein [Dysgonamonadaceae bacterium]|jgi:hypothetical protein|nr:LamG domain-containing protein [Dysgonamonadaceae bacterium]
MRKFFALVLVLPFVLYSCQKWGEWDDPSGNQKNPVPPDASVKVIAHFPFDTDLNAIDTDISGETTVLDGGTKPEITDDPLRGGVLHQNGGYTRFKNPMQGLDVAQGASLSFWVKMPEIDLNGALFSFLNDETKSALYFTGNAWLNYKGAEDGFEINNPKTVLTGVLLPDQWHFVAVTLTYDGYGIYVDGEKLYENNAGDLDYSNMVDLITAAPYFYLGYGSSTKTQEVYFDDVKIYKNQISSSETQPVVTLPEPVYLHTFDIANTATIVGGGNFVPATDEEFGIVFQNAAGGMRENYLQLPEDVLSHSVATKALTVGVWVNASNAGASSVYMWSPLFTAYGAPPADNGNTWPMLALQYRGVVQVNCNGWCDFTDAQNIKGVNTLYHDAADWLVDHQWHYYTATFTETTAKVFFDGVAVNEWEVSGSGGGSEIKGLFSNGADLKYICLGGNQAWDWSDPDPGFMFDDIVIYNVELSAEQIGMIIAEKYGANK